MRDSSVTSCGMRAAGGAPLSGSWPPAWSGASAVGWAWMQRASGQAETDSEAEDAQQQSLVRSPRLARVEAALFVAEGPLSARKLVQLATLADTREANQLLEQLNAMYDAEGSACRVERVATGFRLYTRPEYAWWLDQLHHRQGALKLSPPAMETLTIVAFRQPVIRADIEKVRGVQCTEMLKVLMDRGLVRIAGEDTSLGRPYLYETTRLFLELFGLRSLDDLPLADELRRKPEPPAPENGETEQADGGPEGDEGEAGEADLEDEAEFTEPSDSDEDADPGDAAEHDDPAAAA